MKRISHWKNHAAMSASLLAAPALHAGTNLWFTPLTQSAPVVAPNALEELSAPFVAPEGLLQINWVSLAEVENAVLSPGQSIARASALTGGNATAVRHVGGQSSRHPSLHSP